MSKSQAIPTTQRAYTLRLRGEDRNDHSWRDALWATHEAANKGAKAFGDWLLTLRGGLDHRLADGHPERRQLLALSWLSVESAPSSGDVYSRFVIEPGKESVLTALRDILASRGVKGKALESWIQDCSPSVTADIRRDAVWVNRSAAFDSARQQIGKSLTREEIWDVLDPFFASKEAYFEPVKTSDDDDEAATSSEEKAKDLVQKAGGWLSSRFGAGKGADFVGMAKVYEAMSTWAEKPRSFRSGKSALESLAKSLQEFEPVTNDADGILALISGPGYKSATRNIIGTWRERLSSIDAVELAKLQETAAADYEKCKGNVGGKGRRPWSDALLAEVEQACGFKYLQKDGPARHKEFSVLLDHAARRVSINHTWIKRAESERRKFSKDAEKIHSIPIIARDWLDAFCKQRSGMSGSIDGYRVRKRAIDGWKEVVNKWSRVACKTVQDRLNAARELQADPEIDKFGDIQLFEALAADDAVCVWQIDGKPDPRPLIDYVAATDAQAKRQRFKVPSYRHPDPLLHPVFCDFGNSRWDIRFDIHETRKLKGKKKQPKNQSFVPSGLRMGLWDGTKITDEIRLRWGCKRLTNDLGLTSSNNDEVVDVSRADRAGRAVAEAKPDSSVNIIGLFDQKDWNGRLQVPRKELNAIARVIKNNDDQWNSRALKMCSRLHWLVTFSAKLQPQGPWSDFAVGHKLSPNPIYWPHSEENKKRKGLAKLTLCRLSGLRLLSVDLGHRFAAACAVWETLTEKKLNQEIAGRKIISGGKTADALYLHTQHSGPDNKLRKTIYRRTGPDMWARLDRQFLIKLQGEERPARKASPNEICDLEHLEESLGQVRSDAEKRGLRVDELMSSAVRTIGLALRRHGDVARIAWGLIATSKPLPGGRSQEVTPDDQVEQLQNILMLWYDLANTKNWKDDWAAKQWKTHIETMHAYKEPEKLVEDAAAPQRRKYREQMRESLKPLADALVKQDRSILAAEWKLHWDQNDVAWKHHLKWLRRWLLPRGLAKPKRKIETLEHRLARNVRRGTARHVGGLSLDRIATIRSFYQVLKSYKMRPEPDDPRKNVPAKDDDSLRNFGQRVLNAMEHMREQRVKQLASRIVEAALGIGSENRNHWEDGTKRPRTRIQDPRFAACHAMVIENLTNYRPEETRTRRENRQLMNWSAAKVKKYLSEGCQLHGLHLREVSAAYTSRQDSRTGTPGMRCADVPVVEFKNARHWRTRIKRAVDKNDAESQLLRDLDKNLDGKIVLRLPVKGGDLFISIDGHTLQADLNAAANIGLRALLDPDWFGKWWYVPCETATSKPVSDKTKGSAAINPNQPLITLPAEQNAKKTERAAKSEKDVMNLWRDCSSNPLEPGQFQHYEPYWNNVRFRAIQRLRKYLNIP